MYSGLWTLLVREARSGQVSWSAGIGSASCFGFATVIERAWSRRRLGWRCGGRRGRSEEVKVSEGLGRDG
jgi:hypothetical protein